MVRDNWFISVLIKLAVIYSLHNPISWLVTTVVVWQFFAWFILVMAILVLIAQVASGKINYTGYFRFLEIRKTSWSKPVGIAVDIAGVYYSLIFGNIPLVVLFAALLSFNVMIDSVVELILEKR